ncbi:putative tail measure protein [Corynebacterium phage P1201]|uniref:Putative tail measure protein n=1 Tax=Corynebacterium phage P1201 TaxID=384848 RepID=A7IYB6_9CAUD|nr:tail length tape measure protein [Corynebacterium phage P1201]ABF57499.1 putative tail measure protein [Corynebacterium phage P1201]
MASRGKKVGEAIVRVAPDATNFQRELRNRIKELDKSKKPKINIPVEADVEPAERDLEHLANIADVLNGTRVTIEAVLKTDKFDKDMEKLERKIRDRKFESITEVKLDEDSLNKANRDMDIFREENNTMNTHVFIKTDHAEKTFEKFRDRMSKTVISPVISPQASNMGANQRAMETLGRSIAKTAGRQWTAVSFVPDLLSKMNEQFDAGINQIYTPYIRMVSKAYKEVTKPFVNFRTMLSESKSLNDMMQNILWTTMAIGNQGSWKMHELNKSIKAISESSAEMRKSFGEMMRSIRGIKAPPIFGKMFSRANRDLLKFETSFVNTMKSLPARAHLAIAPMGMLIPDSLKKGLSGMRASLLPYTAQINGIFRGVQGEVQATGIFFRKVGDSMAGTMNSVRDKLSRAWSRIADYSRGATERMSAGMNRFFINTQRRLGSMVDGARGGFARFGSSARTAFGNLGLDRVARTTKAMFSVLGGAVGKVFDNPTLHKGIKRAFGRIGDYASGATRVAIGAFTKLSGFLMKSVLPAVMAVGAGIMAMAGQAAIGAVLTLGGALMSVAQGAMLLAPAFLAAGGVSFAALKFGLEGVGDAVKNAFGAEDTAAFEESIKDMGPEVQSIARAFREFKPAMDTMKENLQTNMLQGLAPGISRAMTSLFPIFSSGLERIGTEWNGAFSMALEELSSDRASAGLSAVMEGAAEMARGMQPVIANLLGAAGSLAEQGAKFLGPLGEYFARASSNFLNWAESLKEIDQATGLSKFDSMIENARINAGYLSDIFGGLLGTIRNLLQAAAVSGGGMLAGMASGMQKLNEMTKKGTEGYQEIVGFMETATLMGKALVALLEPALGIVVTIGTTLAGIGAGGFAGVREALLGIEAGLQPIMAISVEFGKNIGEGIAALSPALEALGGALAPVLLGISEGIKPILESLGGALTPIFETIEKYGPEIRTMFQTVGEAIGSIVDSAGPILESSFDMIGRFLPVLTLVFGYIGKIGSSLLDALAPILQGHDNFLISLADQLMEVVQIIGDFLVGAINAVAPLIPPIVNFIFNLLEFFTPLLPIITKAAIGIGVVVGVVFGLFKAFNFVTTAIKVVQVAWGILSALFSLSPIGMIIIAVAALAAGLWAFFTKTETGRQMWEKFTTALKDGWQSFSDKMKELWDWIVTSVWEPFMAKIQSVKDSFSQKTQDMKDSFQSLRDGFGSVWDWIRDNIFTPFGEKVHQLKDNIGRAVEGIKSVWDTLKQIFSNPITFFVDTVYGKGIRPVWNKIMSSIGQDDKMFPEMTMQRFATGGYVRGPGGPTDDKIPALLSDKEYVINAKAVKAIGLENLHALNTGGLKVAQSAFKSPKQREALMQDRTFKSIASRYATGGLVKGDKAWEQLKRGWDWAKSLSGRPYVLGGDPVNGGGTDCSGYMSSIADKIQGGAGHRQWATMAFNGGGNSQYPSGPQGFVAGLGPGFSIGVTNGGAAGGHTAGTMGPGEDMPATNVESGGSPSRVKFGAGAAGADDSYFRTHYHLPMDIDGGFVSGGGGGGFFDVVGSALSHVTGLLTGAWDGIKGGFGEHFGKAGQFGQAALGMANTMKDGAWGYLKEQAKKQASRLLSFFGIGGGDASSVGLDGVSGSVMEQVKEVFSRHGWTGQQWEDAKWIIGKESSWNPTATNASSGAFGLFQLNPSSGTLQEFLPDRNPDPAIQADAGARYIKRRYNGDPSEARRFWEQHGWYDQGGEGRGKGTMLKNVLEPERVLSPAQTKAFNDFVYGFMPELISQAKSEPLNFRKLGGMLQTEMVKVQRLLAEEREVRISGMAKAVQKRFLDQINGTEQLNPIDMDGLRRIDPRDLKALQDWAGVNSANLTKNLTGAIENVSSVLYDPKGYLEAEKRAKEAIDKEAEEAKAKADEEVKKAEDEKKKAEDEASKEIEKAEDQAATTDEQKEALKVAREERKETEAEAKKAQQEKDSEAQKLEDERISKLKESGEYYYGYKVFGDDGSNPNKREKSNEQSVVESSMSNIAGRVGIGGLVDKVISRASMVESIGQGVQTALPAWMAAANGDFSGLNHNAAVAGAMVLDSAEKEARDLIPVIAGDAFEALVASGTRTPTYGSFINNVYTGMSKSEFNSAIEEYQAKAARKGGGTARK